MILVPQHWLFTQQARNGDNARVRREFVVGDLEVGPCRACATRYQLNSSLRALPLLANPKGPLAEFPSKPRFLYPVPISRYLYVWVDTGQCSAVPNREEGTPRLTRFLRLVQQMQLDFTHRCSA